MDATADGFQIERVAQGTITRIVVVGELDLATAPQLREACAHEQRNGAEVVVLDLSAVSFMDSTGLHALLAAGQGIGQRLGLVVSPSAARVIDITGVRDRLPIIEE